MTWTAKELEEMRLADEEIEREFSQAEGELAECNRFRRYYLLNRDLFLEKARKYREGNRERIRERDRKYYQRNRERILARTREGRQGV